MTDALSAHRHISFTAHYTGYIWYSMGISHPVFATRKGKWWCFKKYAEKKQVGF